MTHKNSQRCKVIHSMRPVGKTQRSINQSEHVDLKYPYHPHRRDLPYDPPPPRWIFQNWPPNFTPPPPLPSEISKIFTHPLEILLSLVEVDKEAVLFTRMSNFVSFMYFLLNCITDKRIPYANSLCPQVGQFHLQNCGIQQKLHEMHTIWQGRVGNITVLFLHCVKKKATLEEVLYN